MLAVLVSIQTITHFSPLQTAYAQGNVALFGNATNSTTVTSSPYQISLSSFDVGAGNGRLLVVGVHANNQSATSVTFGGTPLTQASGSFHNEYTAFWYLTNPSGINKIVVTMSGSTAVVVGAYAFSGVDQANPIPVTATNFGTGNPNVSLTTMFTNSTVIDSASIYGGSTLSGTGCGQQKWNVRITNQVTGASSLSNTGSAGSITCIWTASPSGNGWDDTAIELKASGVNNPLTQVTLNGKSTASGTGSSVTLYNFAAGAASNRLLVVGTSANNNAVSAITFGGVSLTKAVSSFTNNDAEFWYIKNPNGTANIDVTMAGSTAFVVGAYSFSGVNQTDPIPTTAANHNTSPSSPSISLSTKYYNSWVLDLPSIYGGVTLSSPTCTQQWDITRTNTITGASSTKIPISPRSSTCSWTASSGDFWDDVAIEIRSYNPSTGVIIPLYDYPTSAQWTSAISSHNAYPSVQMLAIANQDSGNVASNNSDFANKIKDLQNAGIIVLGYVHTSYGCQPGHCSTEHPHQSLSNVKGNMTRYKTFYNVNGTFVDEMTTTTESGNLTYYGELNRYAKNYLNETFTVGNPGTQISENYNSTFDNLIVWESASLPPTNSYSSWNTNYNKNLFSVLAYSISSSLLNSTYYNNTAKHTGYLYFTDDDGSVDENVWDDISSYLNSTLAILSHN